MGRLAWAFSERNFQTLGLLDALCCQLAVFIAELNTQTYAITVWSISLLQIEHTPLLSDVSLLCQRPCIKFATHNMVMLAWASSPMDYADRPFLEAISACAFEKKSF